MAKKKDQNPKKSNEEHSFAQELKKLKLSAEFGATFPEEKEPEESECSSDEDFLAQMKQFEDAMDDPDEKEIDEVLGFPKFPAVEDLSDEEVITALELVNTALSNHNIELDVIYPTPKREVYRFITEELLKVKTWMTGVQGMTAHFIYEEFYPNHPGDMGADIDQILDYVCSGSEGKLPWRISHELTLFGETVTREAFKATLDDHCQAFPGMSFTGVDLIKTDFDPPAAYATADFSFELDESSDSPGAFQAKAEFYFELEDAQYCLKRLVIEHFGIK